VLNLTCLTMDEKHVSLDNVNQDYIVTFPPAALTDFTINYHQYSFKCHKYVLASQSRYFSILLLTEDSSTQNDPKCNFIDLPDCFESNQLISPSVFSSFLHYLYDADQLLNPHTTRLHHAFAHNDANDPIFGKEAWRFNLRVNDIITLESSGKYYEAILVHVDHNKRKGTLNFIGWQKEFNETLDLYSTRIQKRGYKPPLPEDNENKVDDAAPDADINQDLEAAFSDVKIAAKAANPADISLVAYLTHYFQCEKLELRLQWYMSQLLLSTPSLQWNYLNLAEKYHLEHLKRVCIATILSDDNYHHRPGFDNVLKTLSKETLTLLIKSNAFSRSFDNRQKLLHDNKK
jgi:hypothetical protein